MPLTGDPSKDIPVLIRAGHPQKQAVAIALSRGDAASEKDIWQEFRMFERKMSREKALQEIERRHGKAARALVDRPYDTKGVGIDAKRGDMDERDWQGVEEFIAEEKAEGEHREDAEERFKVSCEMKDVNHIGTGSGSWITKTAGVSASSREDAERKVMDFYNKKGFKNVKVLSVKRGDSLRSDEKVTVHSDPKTKTGTDGHLYTMMPDGWFRVVKREGTDVVVDTSLRMPENKTKRMFDSDSLATRGDAAMRGGSLNRADAMMTAAQDALVTIAEGINLLGQRIARMDSKKDADVDIRGKGPTRVDAEVRDVPLYPEAPGWFGEISPGGGWRIWDTGGNKMSSGYGGEKECRAEAKRLYKKYG